MILPTEIQIFIHLKQEKLNLNGSYNIFPKERLELYSLIGIHYAPIYVRILGWIATLTAKHVLFLWKETEFLSDEQNNSFTPEGLLIMAENSLKRGIYLANLSNESRENIFYYLNSLLLTTEADVPLLNKYVFIASYEALSMVYGNLPFFGLDTKYLNSGVNDYSIPPGQGDAVSASITAYAGSKRDGHIVLSQEKRLEFWNWWLTEAIPQAWELAQ